MRGFTPPIGTIDYALKSDGKIQKSVTLYRTLRYFEVPIPLGKHPTSRYSLVEVAPETGRFHQIRKHFGHISHPIIGDIEHGCNKQNNMFRKTWDSNVMFLHASEVRFVHPVTLQDLHFTANMHPEFCRILAILHDLNLLASKELVMLPPSMTSCEEEQTFSTQQQKQQDKISSDYAHQAEKSSSSPT